MKIQVDPVWFQNMSSLSINTSEDTVEDEDCEFIVAPRCEVIFFLTALDSLDFYAEEGTHWNKQGGFQPCGWDEKQELEDFS